MFKVTTTPQDPLILKLLPIVIQACEILREEYQCYCMGQGFDIEKKSDNSPVTQADYRVNTFLTQALSRISNLPILSEESVLDGRKSWQKFWLLDPLDGTKEFLHQRPEFTINLSLVNEDKTQFAILAIPQEHLLYFCPIEGLPLKYNILIDTWSEYTENTNRQLPSIGLSQSSQKKPEYAEYLSILQRYTDYQVFKAGSAYKFCMVLEDKIDIYPRFHPTCEWDTSAGQCFLERIGGGLVDLKGRAFLYNQRETLLNSGFIAFRNIEMKELAFIVLAEMQHED